MKKQILLCSTLLSLSAIALAKPPILSNEDKVHINNIVEDLKKDECSPMLDKVKVYRGVSTEYGKMTVVTLPAEGCGGGNNWSNYFKVFYQNKSTELNSYPIIENVKIKENIVKVTGIDYKDTDPHCCPTLKKTWIYKLEEGELIEIKK